MQESTQKKRHMQFITLAPNFRGGGWPFFPPAAQHFHASKRENSVYI